MCSRKRFPTHSHKQHTPEDIGVNDGENILELLGRHEIVGQIEARQCHPQLPPRPGSISGVLGLLLVLLFAERHECSDDHEPAVVCDEIVRQIKVLELASSTRLPVELAFEVQEPRANV
jgi:hypothetical protein